MSKSIQYAQIHAEHDDDVISLTSAKHKLFLAHGKTGLDAELLFIHLIFTAQLQKTNSVWATDKYLREGLRMSRPRIKKAKSLLHSLNLIAYKQTRSEKGVFDGWYITVHCSKVLPKQEQPVGAFTGPMVNGPYGFRHQMLKQETKCFNEEVKCLNDTAIKDSIAEVPIPFSLQLAPPIPSVDTTPIAKKKAVNRKSTESQDFAAAEQLLYPPGAEYKPTPRQRAALRAILKNYALADVLKTVERLQSLKSGNDSWWRQQPVVPTVLLSSWERINEASKGYKTTEELYGGFKSQRDKDEYDEMMR